MAPTRSTTSPSYKKHTAGLVRDPAAWMPWNYRETLAQAGDSKAGK
jgi:hypothetical protein